ncbi:MAG TPA: IS66 family transposase zinc-finger binding domain-containing protein [Kofleriaceae bacterium]|nr:IS66 family transposase zinc-finger binding domain-containing protein [Kofleriaceae bacterium]
MTRRLARIAARFKKSEKVGKAQLVLFLDALRRGEGEPEVAGDESPDEIDEADARLRGASGIDAENPDEDLATLQTRKPPRQPPTRAAAPAHLSRVDNPILVPPEQRACPKCGAERVCIGHDITEVIELVPARPHGRRRLEPVRRELPTSRVGRVRLCHARETLLREGARRR